MEDRSLAKAAATEAFEEAGAKGKIRKKPVGTYSYTKSRKNGEIIQCEALAYEMEVADIKKKFPESEIRTARWASKKLAIKSRDEAGRIPACTAHCLHVGIIHIDLRGERHACASSSSGIERDP